MNSAGANHVFRHPQSDKSTGTSRNLSSASKDLTFNVLNKCKSVNKNVAVDTIYNERHPVNKQSKYREHYFFKTVWKCKALNTYKTILHAEI